MTSEIAPPGVDTTRPSIARVYDYYLGGKDNFAVDRKAAEMALKVTPDGAEVGRACRAFLRRSVRYLAGEAGIRQFLDIGSGLPTQGNVHEIAHQVDPQARVVYVDNDPMALAHGRALLADARTTTVVGGDLREPEKILEDPEVRQMIDFDRPVGLLLLAVLHHLHDDEGPGDITRRLTAALPSGSYLAISHFHDPGDANPEVSQRARRAEKVFNETLGTGRWRTHQEISAFFGDLELSPPGLVPLADWRPDGAGDVRHTDIYHTIVGGVARKP
ncbi:SAM-dependent methyltransferase [Plantactinospora sp. S1510]|uniref:SAM-dependent methyltransferase n=1 Tax=Plantactinospora alkalitolerans TaxID=2789879 RepID=A0ABS0GSY8_9ACTN|nr:SAM-dependent methyltransferase [Plantactinospora alkalitolerans]MBF9129012.1 SAM-dependent methyltransferase [Plantactinospora alkalitolerans]